MIKRPYKLIMVLILSSFLSGCWDYKDINRRTIALSVGIDEVQGMVQFTGENAQFLGSVGKGGERAQITEDYNYSNLGRNFEETRREYDRQIPLRDFSGAMRVVVFSEKVATKDIEPYINRINFLTELRKSVLVVVSKDPPGKLFQSEVDNDINISYAIEDTIRQLSSDGKLVYKTAQELQSDIQEKSMGYVIPYIGLDKKTIKSIGLSVMKGGKMVGIIDNNEIYGFLYLLINKVSVQNTIPNPDTEEVVYSIKNTLKKRKIKTNYEDGKVNVNIDLVVNMQLQYMYNIERLNEHIIKEIELETKNKIKKEILTAIEKSQNEFKCDLFGFGKYFRADNPKAYKEIKWDEEYPKANFNVNVQVKLANVNLMNLNAKKRLKE